MGSSVTETGRIVPQTRPRRRTLGVRSVGAAVAVVTALASVACSSSSSNKPATSASNQSPERLAVMDRLDDATTLIREFQGKLPEAVTKEARCIVVVPSMIKGGLILGGRHGDGFAVCRADAMPGQRGSDDGGPAGWSEPAPVSVSGGSAGLQLGVESVDLLMVVESDSGMRKLLSSKFEIGADVSATAGPVGRGRQVGTDTTMKSEVYAYTRSRGLFAGAELSGAVVEQDADATLALYRANKDFRTLLSAHGEPETDASRRFVDAVREVMH